MRRTDHEPSYRDTDPTLLEQEDMDIGSFADGFITDIKGYVGAQRRYLMLLGRKKVAGLLGKAVHSIALMTGAVITLLFMLVSLAIYLGEVLSSYPLGFLATSGIVLLLLGIFHLWWSGGGKESFMLSRINDFNDDDDDEV